MKGIVYLYISPNCKCYVGQTFSEKNRRKTFLTNPHYAGDKIDRARLKYGTINFIYEVLFECDFNSYEEGYPILDIIESYYIKYYDSYVNGYNMTEGGSKDFRGYTPSEEFKRKCAKRMTLNNSFKGSKHTPEAKLLISEANTKYPVIMINKITGEEEMEFRNASEACVFLGLPNKARNDIYKVCRGYVNPNNGRKNITAHGYKWKYKESSTTSKSSNSNEAYTQVSGNGGLSE
jgi:group I intron endonuclease